MSASGSCGPEWRWPRKAQLAAGTGDAGFYETKIATGRYYMARQSAGDRDASGPDPVRGGAGDGAGRGEFLMEGCRLHNRTLRETGPPMPKRFRLTRRFPVAMTEDGYRRLKRFAQEAGLDEGEAL